MMDMKHPMFSALVLLITAANCVASGKTDLNSKVGDGNVFQRHVSNNRAKRLSLFPLIGHGGHLYPVERLDDGVDSLSDTARSLTFPCQFVSADDRSRDESVSSGNSKRNSNFIRIGRSVSANNHLDRFRRAPKLDHLGSGTSRFAHPCNILSTGRNTNSEHFGQISGADIAGYTDYDESGLSENDLGGSDSDMRSSLSLVKNSIDKDTDIRKRASSFVRIGKSFDGDKRASHFVRIGKSEGGDYDDKAKRSSSFVRIGKSGLVTDMDPESSKRSSSFVRIGKSGLVTDMDPESSKRSSTFLRIGKLAPRDNTYSLPYYLDDSSDSVLDDARFIKRGSSFVRIGRSLKNNSDK